MFHKSAPARPMRDVFETVYALPKGPLLPPTPAGSDGMLTTEIWADSPEDARRIAKRRHMGEKLEMTIEAAIMCAAARSDPYKLPSEWWDAGKPKETLHALCWLGMAALASGVADWSEMLGDGGLIHGLAHLMEGDEGSRSNAEANKLIRAKMGDALRDLERRTPGFGKYRDDPNP